MEEATNSVTVMPDEPAESIAPVTVQSYVETVDIPVDSFEQAVELFPDECLVEQPVEQPVEHSAEETNGEMDGSISSMDISIQAINSRTVASKWLKTSVLRQDPRVARHIPDTRIYTPSALSSMLEAYGKIVLKPVIGTGGVGLIMITRSGGQYLVRHRYSVRRYVQIGALIAAVNRMRRRRRYLIQRGITLATINGRPIDYRVKVIRKKQGWVTKAMVGRLARHGLFVTNICRGGTLLTSAEGIRRSLSASAVQTKKNEMRHLTSLCVSMLERAFPGVGQLGFDYGIDQNGKLWIFEVNTAPH